MSFVELENTRELSDTLRDDFVNANNVVLVKPVQGSKTSDVLKLVEITHKTSATVFISDRNKSLTAQTNGRARTCGWSILNFSDVAKKGNPYESLNVIRESMGKKRLFHTMMEINNLTVLYSVLSVIDVPVTLIIDEADKNRNVANFEEDEEDSLPVITRLILKIKNMLLSKNNGSRVVFVTATPQSLLVSEKDERRLVIYKKPYNNYVGAGLNHTPNIEVIIGVRDNTISSTNRWTNSIKDCQYNTYRHAIASGVDRFMKLESKDTTVKQLMLITLESRNRNQEKVAEYVKTLVGDSEVGVLVFNGESRDIPTLLSEAIKYNKNNKIVIVSGFMASRGVSFTDFSDADNKFELCIQLHYTKAIDPLNSAAQAMRIFGPARRTITRPIMICNRICAEDLMRNFSEAYRVIKELAQGNETILTGSYSTYRPLTQKYNFRYMQQYNYGNILLRASNNPEDHELVV